MKPFATLALFVLAAPVLCQKSAGTFTISPDGVERISVEARHFESGIDGSSMLATGDVRAEIRQRSPGSLSTAPIIIEADTLTADLRTTFLSAEGHVTVETDKRVVRGSRVIYNWTDKRGRVEAVLLQTPGLSFRAETVDFSPGGLLMHHVAFGGCGLENPDYLFRANTLKMGTNRRITARNASVDLFGHEMVRLPRLAYHTRPRSGSGSRFLPIPRPGYSRISGPSIAQAVPLTDELTAEVELTSRLGMRGVIDYRRDGRVTPYADLDWKQQHSGRKHLSVLVSRLPEAGIRFGTHSEGTFNAGYYREHTTGVSGGRVHLGLDHTMLDRGEAAGLRLSVGGRASAYTTGKSYADAHFETSVGRDRQKIDVYEEIGIRENAIVGESPFEWDQVPVTSELFAGKRIAWGAFRFEGRVRYDIGNRKVYDVNYAVARRFNCLTPEISYSRRKQSISIDITVQTPGL